MEPKLVKALYNEFASEADVVMAVLVVNNRSVSNQNQEKAKRLFRQLLRPCEP